ncbi:hypothetical protein VKT23_004415 [Stygiomarasmius scandens]|uniref:Uncharacterized protein n=1 Tax=Marasmiellus scandens TaxID=2682957 RepID=A0ABR1JYM0_9AGAR
MVDSELPADLVDLSLYQKYKTALDIARVYQGLFLSFIPTYAKSVACSQTAIWTFYDESHNPELTLAISLQAPQGLTKTVKPDVGIYHLFTIILGPHISIPVTLYSHLVELKKAISRQKTTIGGLPIDDTAVVYFQSLHHLFTNNNIFSDLIPNYVVLVAGIGPWFTSTLLYREHALTFPIRELDVALQTMGSDVDRAAGDTDGVPINPPSTSTANLDFRLQVPIGWSPLACLDTPDGNKAFKEMEYATLFGEMALNPISIDDA